ncbi:hypothetical protein ANCDUO_15044 [Ancylostoma duodenale]|uniref:Homeobox domain-containing protein n=1 Tax=Ancylostoma duodenale TaxID=51022 RepID=A0A0C2CYA2_9BILA|nr:hypothetical protein ANCDUO_15044 [Ancylostoma duodenale]
MKAEPEHPKGIQDLRRTKNNLSQVWFKNRRAKARQQKKSQQNSSGASSGSSSTEGPPPLQMAM